MLSQISKYLWLSNNIDHNFRKKIGYDKIYFLKLKFALIG